MRCGGFTAAIDRPTKSHGSEGWSARRPGRSNSTEATSSLSRSNFSTWLAAMSDTYQNDPSGSTATWCGFAFAPYPMASRSMTSTTSCVSRSMTVTAAASWLAT